MKKILATALIASTVFTSAAFADGHKGGQHGHFGKGHNPAKIYRKLALSDAQKTQIKAIFKDTRPSKADRDTMRAERKAQMEKRRAIIEAPILDINAVNQMAKDKAEKVQSRFVKMLKAEHKAWKVLTPEQQAKAKDMMQQRAERMEKRAEKRKN